MSETEEYYRVQNTPKPRQPEPPAPTYHYVGCWNHPGHHACAIKAIDELQSNLCIEDEQLYIFIFGVPEGGQLPREEEK